MPTVKVIYRKWRDSSDVIAVFPERPAEISGHFCDSYSPVGQHAGADYFIVIRQTVPARRSEYAALSVELKRIGYNLKPIKRALCRHHQRRREAARCSEEPDTHR